MQYLDCPGCGRNLCRYDMGALRPGKSITIRCRDCKRIATLTGHPGGILGDSAPDENGALPHAITAPPVGASRRD